MVHSFADFAPSVRIFQAVLGIGSIIEAFPYSVPKYVPELVRLLLLLLSSTLPLRPDATLLADPFE
jgi:hypothetical protein